MRLNGHHPDWGIETPLDGSGKFPASVPKRPPSRLGDWNPVAVVATTHADRCL